MRRLRFFCKDTTLHCILHCCLLTLRIAISSWTVDGSASSDAYKTATIALSVLLGIAIVVIVLLIVYIVYMLSDKGLYYVCVELADSSTTHTELRSLTSEPISVGRLKPSHF